MRFLRRKLKNGITVLMELRESPVVSVSISNPIGGEHETSDIKGICHLIEHLLFTGTQTRSHEDISREIEKKGGILNAFTDHEVTSFWFKLPKEYIFSGLDILVDMLSNPKFDEEKFEKEKKIILEEIKMYHDDPRKDVFEQLEKNLFEKPFGELVIGSSSTLNSIDRNFVIVFFKKNYLKSNFIVTIVGDADFNQICDYIEKSFSVETGIIESVPIKIKNTDFTEEREGIDQANLVIGMHGPLPNEEDYSALELLNAYLAEGMSSKMFLEIREKLGLSYNISGIIRPGKNFCYYVIYAGTTKEAIQQVKNAILEEFRKVKNMSEKDLEESKQMLLGLKKISSEESVNVMNELLYYEIFGNAEDFYKYEEKIKAVNLSQVKDLAKKLIKNTSTVVISPK